MIVLRAVTRAVRGEVDLEGWSVHTVGSLSVLHEEVTEDAEAASPPTRDSLAEHGRRLARLAERLALLPVRYDTRVATLEELESLVAEHEDAWKRRLAVVDGQCELILHVCLPQEGSADRPASGREYLLQRAEVLHAQQRVWEEVTELVRPSAREVRMLPDGRRLAMLVPRDQVARVRELVDDWAGQHPQAEVAVTGPWPPFSFCEEPAES